MLKKIFFALAGASVVITALFWGYLAIHALSKAS